MEKKLKLEDLQVQSFVTSLSEEEQAKLEGGGTNYYTPLCCTFWSECWPTNGYCTCETNCSKLHC